MIDSAFQFVDIYATKGIEYIIVVVFFVFLIFFYRSIFRPLWKKIAMKWSDR